MFRKSTYTPKRTRRCLLFLEIALYLVVIGLLIQIFFVRDSIQSAFDAAAQEALIISSNNTLKYSAWANNTQSQQRVSFYIFNITNPREVIDGNYPQLSEIGPFIFDRFEKRRSVHFSDNGNIVNYKYVVSYIFNEEVTDRNIVALWNHTTWNNYYINDTYNYDEYPSIFVPSPFILALLSLCRLHIDVVYGGITVSACRILGNNFGDNHVTDMHIFTNHLNITFQELMQTGIHSDTLNRSKAYINDSDIYISEYTGNDNSNKMRELISMYQRDLHSLDPPFWSSSEIISGNRETKQFPYKSIKTNSKLNTWSQDKMRHVQLIYNGTIEIQQVECYKFIINPIEYLSAENNPINSKYYQTNYDGQQMSIHLRDGLLNLTSSNYNNVLQYSSKPYFLDAKYYQQHNGLMGLRQPNRSIDDTYFAIEPNLGTVFDARFSFQVSFALYPCLTSGLLQCNGFGSNFDPNMIIPGFYVVVNAGPTTQTINDYKDILSQLDVVGQYSIYLAPAVAFGAFVIALLLSLRRYCKLRKKNVKRNTLYMVDSNIHIDDDNMYDVIDNAEDDINGDFSLKQYKTSTDSHPDDSLFTGFAKRDSSIDKTMHNDDIDQSWSNYDQSSSKGNTSLSSLLKKGKKKKKKK